jgi:hypothetical protein
MRTHCQEVSIYLLEWVGKRFFSIMDLKDAFHQIPLHEESRPITGTSTPIGLQQWRVVMMGWKKWRSILSTEPQNCIRTHQ